MNYTQNATILAIDDDLLALAVLGDYLSDFCKQVILQNDVKTALTLAEEKQPDLILLDILMLDVDGYEVCRRLKQNDNTQQIPVIFLSSLVDAADKVKGFEAGGVDYISKPYQFEEVLARIENCLKLRGQINQAHKITTAEREEKMKRYHLTKREIEIFNLYAVGCQRTEIAKQLLISENTVKWHIKNILIKFNVKNRVQAIEKWRGNLT